MNEHLRLIRQARATGVLFALIVLAGFLVGGFAIWQSWLLAGAVNNVFLNGQALADLGNVLRLLLLVFLLRAVFTVVNEHLSGLMSVRLKNELREQLLQKIDRLGPIFLKDEKSGELATTALQGLDALDAYFGQFLPQILLAAMLPLTMLIVVFPVDPLTALIFLLTAPLIPIFMVLIGRLSKSHTNRQWHELSRLGAFFLTPCKDLPRCLSWAEVKIGQIKLVKQVSDTAKSP
jgi:ATP-binding cassette subfamily C protein CydD